MAEAFSYALVNEGNEFTHNADRFELTAGAFPLRKHGVKPAIREAD